MAGGRFQDRAPRGEVAAQHRDPALLLERLRKGEDHVAVPAHRILHVLPQGVAVRGHRILVEEPGFGKLLVHRGQSTRVVEVLHQVLAGRHEIHDARHVAPERVPVVEGEVGADAPGQRQQVHDRVGGAADGAVGTNGVLERLGRKDLRHGEILLHHLHDPPARHMRENVAPRVRGGDGGVGRQRHAERLGHAGHRRRGSHRHAVTDRARHARFRVHELLHRHVAGPAPCPRTFHTWVPEPICWSRNRPLSIGPPETTRAGRSQLRRAHEQGGGRLVATDKQHHAVERMGANGLLDVHAHQIAIQHRRRPHQGLAERHHRELEREPSHLVPHRA